MFYYNRKIVYIDLIEKGEKKRNAGFLKLEETEKEITWKIQIKNLGEAEAGYYELQDETGAAVDKIFLEHGRGHYERCFDRRGISRGGRCFGQMRGIRMELSGTRTLAGRWEAYAYGGDGSASQPDENTSQPDENAPLPDENAPLSDENTAAGEPVKKHTAEPSGSSSFAASPVENGWFCTSKEEMGKILLEEECLKAADREKAEQEAADQKAAEQEAADQNTAAPNTAAPDTAADSEETSKQNKEAGKGASLSGNLLSFHEQAPVSCERCARRNRWPAKKKETEPQELAEDKWEQLEAKYPHVHPFGDEREYLSIAPGDFVVLGREYHKLVNNSFLLHGYYNYRHVILGKFGKEEDEKYYLGVPGVFYDREKRAAEMFGFEAFEGKVTPAEEGSFGYYMKQVRI